MNSNPGQLKPDLVQTIAICLCQLLVIFHISAGPIWVFAAMKSGLLSASATGTLASVESIVMAVGTLGFTALKQKLNPRIVIIASAVALVGTNLINAVPGVEALIAGRLLGGLAKGVIAACLLGLVAERPDSLKVFALFSAVGIVGGAAVNLMLPLFAGEGGSIARLYMITAGVGVIAAFVGFMAIPRVMLHSSATEKKTGRIGITPILAGLAYAALGIGAGAIAPYGLVIGRGLGFSIDSLGQVGAISIPMGLIGSIAAHRFGERAGLVAPVFIGLLIVPATWLIMVRAESLFVYGLMIAIGMVTFSFIGPYLMTLIARLDASGRVITAMPAFVLLGLATGPKVGGTVLAFGHFSALAYVGTVFFIVGLALFMAAVALAKRLNIWERDVAAGT